MEGEQKRPLLDQEGGNGYRSGGRMSCWRARMLDVARSEGSGRERRMSVLIDWRGGMFGRGGRNGEERVILVGVGLEEWGKAGKSGCLKDGLVEGRVVQPSC